MAYTITVSTAQSQFYRDEIFTVTVTVTGTPSPYIGTLNLTLSQGQQTQTLGSRGTVQMYDFASGQANPNCTQNTSITSLTFTTSDNGTKTFKAVINIAQTVKIKATDTSDPSLWGESNAITILSRIRQYTTKHNNATVNNYDSNINCWLNYWTDWKIGNPAYTFLCGAKPPNGDFVKAIAYKESTMKLTNIMQVTQSPALNSMTTGYPAEYDPNASAPKDANGCSSLEEPDWGAPRMDYGTPTADTVDNSFKWGIRWYIAKNSLHDYNTGPCPGKVWNMRIQPSLVAALNAYRGAPDEEPDYGDKVMKLYEEGKIPIQVTRLICGLLKQTAARDYNLLKGVKVCIH